MKADWILASVMLLATSAAHAAPGLDEVVYGATVEPGKSEIEARYGRLTVGSADGEDALVLEAAHGFSSRFYGAALATFEREPDRARHLETVAVEGIFTLGRIEGLGVDAAVYGELEHGIHGHDNVETKLLLERRFGRFDSRLNLIAERAMIADAPVEFSYAASADYAVGDDIGVGAEAFGELGTSRTMTTRGEHFVGPSAKIEFDHAGPGELELRAGYLFAIDRARNDSKGQLRFGLEYEF